MANVYGAVFFFFKFLFDIGVELMSNVILVSGVEQSDSVIYIHVSMLSQILFPFRLRNIEQSSLCYPVGPCWLSILYILVCTCQSQSPNLSLPPTPRYGYQWKSVLSALPGLTHLIPSKTEGVL